MRFRVHIFPPLSFASSRFSILRFPLSFHSPEKGPDMKRLNLITSELIGLLSQLSGPFRDN